MSAMTAYERKYGPSGSEHEDDRAMTSTRAGR
jgi:hypothetical protein